MACIDLSDGLRADLAHLLGPGLELPLALEDLPLPPGFRARCRRLGIAPEPLALAGGEDYELLFSVRGRFPSEAQLARRLGLPVRELGQVRRAPRARARGDSGAPPGWRHF
jgi:thiamine-monophosphate kinase